jgi:hypothetical protein
MKRQVNMRWKHLTMLKINCRYEEVICRSDFNHRVGKSLGNGGGHCACLSEDYFVLKSITDVICGRRRWLKAYILLIISSVLYIVGNPPTCYATCPACILNVHLSLAGQCDSGDVSVEIKDKLATRVVELQCLSECLYEGLVEYQTMGLVLFVELTCTYRPKYIIIHVGSKSKKIKLDWKKISQTARRGNCPYAYTFDVNVLLDIKDMAG